MTEQEGIEAIKRHMEAIREIAKEIGCADYLSMAILNNRDGYMAFSNDPYREDYFSVVYQNASGWRTGIQKGE